jgi:hypothetical protein
MMMVVVVVAVAAVVVMMMRQEMPSPWQLYHIESLHLPGHPTSQGNFGAQDSNKRDSL